MKRLYFRAGTRLDRLDGFWTGLNSGQVLKNSSRALDNITKSIQVSG